MSNNINRPSARNQAVNALEKVDNLEAKVGEFQTTLSAVMRAMSNGLTQIQSQAQEQITALSEQIEAVIRILGAPQVATTIDAMRIERVEAVAAQSKANIAVAIAEGKLVTAEIVDEESIVTGIEYQASGDVVPGGGYAAMKFTEIKPEFRDAMKGQKVGVKVDLANGGGTFLIEQILKIAPVVAAAEPAPEATVAAVPETTVTPETAVQE